MLGTFVEIAVPQVHASAIESAFAVMAHVHARMSFHEATSDLARLRTAMPSEVVELDVETVRVLRLALELHAKTDGVFDVAVGRPLVRAGFLPREGIDYLAAYTGTSADIVIVDDYHVRIARRVLVDLGGIAKGHAVDLAIEALQHAGVSEGLVNAGGDLRAFGERDWPVSLRDADDIVRHIVSARNCAIASSANVLNRRRHRGREQTPHIGRGGEPIRCDHRTSVIAPLCIVADAMTKVAMADRALAEDVLHSYDGYLLDSAENGMSN